MASSCRNYRPCRDCGHYGHAEGRFCPLRNVLAQEGMVAARREEERRTLDRIFPHRPDLAEVLEKMQLNWRAKLVNSMN